MSNSKLHPPPPTSTMAADPLDLLRQSITSDQPATLVTSSGSPTDSLAEAASLTFAGDEPVTLSKDEKTRYWRSAAKDDFYTLGQLWLAWTERDSNLREYREKAAAANVGAIAIADRLGVLNYLKGVADGGDRVLGKGEDAGVAAPVAEAGPSRPAQAKRKYEVNVADREFCKKLRAEEVELQDRNTVLRVAGSGKVNNFEHFVKSVMSEKIRALRKSFESRSQPVPVAPVDPNRARKAKSNHPIIIISSSPTSLLTMWNVKKFLEQGIFEPSEVARANEAQLGNTRPEDMVPILRKRASPTGDITTKYYVVDSVEALQKFGQEPWDRVLCVVTTGQAWQFKPYKWMEPRTLFRHVKGVYFQWSGEPANPAVKDWNVTEMRIDRAKRHTDKQVVAEFWRVLDAKRR